MLLSSMDGTSADAVSGLLRVLFSDAKTTFDPTYGNGNFWNETQPTYAADILPARARQIVADYRALPLAARSVDVVIFDPPFQPSTSRRQAGERELRFTHVVGGVAGVRASIEVGLRECARVARLGLIVKVQDYIHDHKPVWMSRWVWETLGDPYDFLTLRLQCPKMRASNWKDQRSVWRNHSTFWVYRWRSLR